MSSRLMRLCCASVVCITLIVLLGGINVHAEGDLREAPQSEIRTPLVVLEPLESLELGKVPVYTMASREVRVTNTSGRTIEVTVPRVTCSCLSATIAREQLAPAEWTIIHIDIDVRFPGGAQEHGIVVSARTLDDGEERRATATIPVSFTPERTFAIVPGDTLHFRGCVGVPERRLISLINTRGRTVRPLKVWFQDIDGWRLESIVVLEPGMQGPVWRITLEGLWDAPGFYDGWVVIETDDETTPVYSVRLVGRVDPPARISPRARLANVGEMINIQAKTSGTWRVVSMRIDELPGELESADTEDGLTFGVKQPGRYRVPITLVLEREGTDVSLEWPSEVFLIVRAEAE